MTAGRNFLLALAGVVAVIVAGQVAGPDPAGAMGLAMLAALGLSLMLRVTGRRILGALVGLLGIGAGIAFLANGFAWWDVLGVAGALAALLGGVTALLLAHRWPRREGAGSRVEAPDPWKQLDAGQDPTDPR